MQKKLTGIAVDIESSGFSNKKNDMIQLAAVEIYDDYTLGETFFCSLKPARTQYWSPNAEKVHGITLTEALDFDSRRDSLIRFMHWLKRLESQFPLTFISHSKNQWDYKFVKETFLKEVLHESFEKVFSSYMHESTIDLSKELLPGLRNYKLSTVCEHLRIDLNHHQALSDAIACAKIYCFLKKNIKLYSPDLFQ